MNTDLRIDDVIRQTLALFRQGRVAFLSAIFLASAVSIIGDWLYETLTGREAPVFNAGALLIAMLLSAYVTAMALQLLHGTPAVEREAWLMVRRRLPSVLGASLVAGMLMTFGVLLLVIPALYMMCRWLVSTAAILDEDRGWQSGMQRSAWLTDGLKWRLLPVCLAYLGAIFLAATTVAVVVSAILTPEVARTTSLVRSSVTLAFIANFAMTWLSAMGSIGQAILYRRLVALRGPMPAPGPDTPPL